MHCCKCRIRICVLLAGSMPIKYYLCKDRDWVRTAAASPGTPTSDSVASQCQLEVKGLTWSLGLLVTLGVMDSWSLGLLDARWLFFFHFPQLLAMSAPVERSAAFSTLWVPHLAAWLGFAGWCAPLPLSFPPRGPLHSVPLLTSSHLSHFQFARGAAQTSQGNTAGCPLRADLDLV